MALTSHHCALSEIHRRWRGRCVLYPFSLHDRGYIIFKVAPLHLDNDNSTECQRIIRKRRSYPTGSASPGEAGRPLAVTDPATNVRIDNGLPWKESPRGKFVTFIFNMPYVMTVRPGWLHFIEAET